MKPVTILMPDAAYLLLLNHTKVSSSFGTHQSSSKEKKQGTIPFDEKYSQFARVFNKKRKNLPSPNFFNTKH